MVPKLSSQLFRCGIGLRTNMGAKMRHKTWRGGGEKQSVPTINMNKEIIELISMFLFWLRNEIWLYLQLDGMKYAFLC